MAQSRRICGKTALDQHRLLVAESDIVDDSWILKRRFVGLTLAVSGLQAGV